MTNGSGDGRTSIQFYRHVMLRPSPLPCIILALVIPTGGRDLLLCLSPLPSNILLLVILTGGRDLLFHPARFALNNWCLSSRPRLRRGRDLLNVRSILTWRMVIMPGVSIHSSGISNNGAGGLGNVFLLIWISYGELSVRSPVSRLLSPG